MNFSLTYISLKIFLSKIPPKNNISKNIMDFTKTPFTPLFLLTLLLITTFTITRAVRPDPTQTLAEPLPVTQPQPQPQGTPFGFDVPDFSKVSGSGSVASGSFGFGFGGPSGGYFKTGTMAPTQVCNEQGPCYQMTLTCPDKCYKSFSNSGEGFGYGAAGGGCNFDCKTKCTADC